MIFPKININDLMDEDIVIDAKKTNKRKTKVKSEIIEKEGDGKLY